MENTVRMEFSLVLSDALELEGVLKNTNKKIYGENQGPTPSVDVSTRLCI